MLFRIENEETQQRDLSWMLQVRPTQDVQHYFLANINYPFFGFSTWVWPVSAMSMISIRHTLVPRSAEKTSFQMADHSLATVTFLQSQGSGSDSHKHVIALSDGQKWSKYVCQTWHWMFLLPKKQLSEKTTGSIPKSKVANPIAFGKLQLEK